MPLALDTQRRALCVREGEGLRGQCGVIFVSLIRAGVGQLVLAYCPWFTSCPNRTGQRTEAWVCTGQGEGGRGVTSQDISSEDTHCTYVCMYCTYSIIIRHCIWFYFSVIYLNYLFILLYALGPPTPLTLPLPTHALPIPGVICLSICPFACPMAMSISISGRGYGKRQSIMWPV